jgi:hypothetical protein
MKTLSRTFAVVFCAVAFAVLAAAPKKMGQAKAEAKFLTPEDITWGAAPPDLPPGVQMAVLSGDPTKAGHFTLRLKMPDGYKIPPHWHTQDENITVLSGTFVLHMGDTMEAPAHEMTAMGYHYLPGKAHHAAEAKGETILQLNGQGPFDIHYLNPADKPKAAMR